MVSEIRCKNTKGLLRGNPANKLMNQEHKQADSSRALHFISENKTTKTLFTLPLKGHKKGCQTRKK